MQQRRLAVLSSSDERICLNNHFPHLMVRWYETQPLNLKFSLKLTHPLRIADPTHFRQQYCHTQLHNNKSNQQISLQFHHQKHAPTATNTSHYSPTPPVIRLLSRCLSAMSDCTVLGIGIHVIG